MIKGSILKHPNIYFKKKLTEPKEINSNTIIVGNFNTPLSTMARSSRQNQ